MNKIFNTVFEMSLRLLLILSVDEKIAKTSDMLVLTDTIAIYGREFGIANTNLHGGISYVLDEYDTRRELVKSSLKDLAMRGLVQLMETEEGFLYAITHKGAAFAEKLVSDYAVEYRVLAASANNLISGKSEREIFDLIRTICEKSLNGRYGNG